jgi:hypothetical protein
MAPIDQPPYRLSMLTTAEERLRSLASLAVERGVEFEFARDLDSIRHRLRTDPARWGDPLFDYRKLDMTHFRGRSEFLYSFFSVNELGRVVFVQAFSINPYSRLA